MTTASFDRATSPVENAAGVPLLLARDVSKSFGGARALARATLAVAPGEVHGLVGANGAGKSTMIRCIAGLVQPDEGEIQIDGVPHSIDTPHRATDLGMSFIHQELVFIPGMTVLENIMLGVPKKTRLGLVDWKTTAQDIRPLIERVGITAPLDTVVKRLSTAENWLISICRALVRKARLIVMDEPTASLSAHEAEKLMSIIEDLSASGVAVLYVSHRLDEILRLCRRVTVFRDGASVASLDRSALTRSALVEAIVGGAVTSTRDRIEGSSQGRVAMSVQGLTRLPKVRGVSLELRQGEVLGIGGLVGAGRSELARLMFGADRPEAGRMTLDGGPYAPRHPAEAVKAGLGFVPEERRADGLVLTKSVGFNLQLSNLQRIVRSPAFPLLDRPKSRALSAKMVKDLAIKIHDLDQPVGRLSGGNQQKVVIGRWLLRTPRVLILDEPTRGVDVGARAEIHRLIRQLAKDGVAVLVISSEPDELPDLCDRVLVMSEGRMVAELAGAELTRNAIVEASYADGTTVDQGGRIDEHADG
ncbi:MAG TPA: sugar ABC transporter ATP-binding protein [Geminicoccus sp.]|uniref:sugar ABC transporter ATP-binding protein n=1 Tax=Geminicoccus sp. TaxID=2024832 RepID=UPI002E30378D|nr:sugar ABC transporter ATP-binding protein [Geminicoccus sp.]HEX2527973.1 sugar ABC transporter ATP-binding protein [Geminicoccus sp.]